ncbi:MAG: ParB/RepB/Spo0J family partition protein [Bacteroidales bacterium]|jgi:ParB family chromosome partitioning protein
MQGKKKVLGRGLSAILESPETDITSRDISGEYVVGAIAHIPVEKIESNPFQPRMQFNEDELAELTLSIQEQGIIQPITVRKLGYDKYQLISGERRLKAAKLAGLAEIPTFIRIANDEQMLELALVENIQREELNPLEIAMSFQRLLDECKLKQEELSKKVGKDRSTVANYIRLLKLPAEIQIAIRDNKISMGHARALINIEDVETQIVILHRIFEKKLSVRQVEEIVRNIIPGKPLTRRNEPFVIPIKIEKLRDSLAKKLDTKVDIKFHAKGDGTIIIPFRSDEELDLIITKL